MALVHGQVTITTSATLIHKAGADGDSDTLHIHCPSGGQSVFIGGASVTAANGFELKAGSGDLVFNLEAGDSVYGTVAATTQGISYLAIP